MEAKKKQERAVVHLEKDGQHHYYGKPKALCDHWGKDAASAVHSVSVLGLGLFALICGFDCLIDLIEMGAFFFLCFLATIAINLCLLFHIQFIPRKIERIIAIIYLILFVLSLYFLSLINAFGLLNFPADAQRWDVIRIWITILFTDYCVFWLAVRCLRLLRLGHSPLMKDTPK